MEILLDSITADPSDLELTADAAELELHLELANLVTPVDYKLTAWRMEDEIFLNGTVTYTMQQTCARCLVEYEVPYSLKMDLVLQMVQDDLLRQEADEGEEFIMISSSLTTFVLDQQLRDLITFENPLKPLCRGDCAGLCPRCGTNLNEQGCNCIIKEDDPRWDALKNLSNNN